MSNIVIVRIPASASQKTQRITLPQEPQSLNEASSLLPGGVYTTFRTYQKRYVLYLYDHFDRLETSARLTGRPISVDAERIRFELRKSLAHFPVDEARVRISIDLSGQIGEVYLILEPLRIPSIEEYRDGVSVITRKMHRENPQAKVTSFILEASEIRRQEEQGQNLNETLMVNNQDLVLEGLTSNFFGVREGILYTAGEGVLPGITRKMVIEVAQQSGYAVRLQNIPLDDLGRLSEAFITSASRAILPVTHINNRPVGSGQVGKITRALQIAFQKNLDASLDKI